MCSAMENLPFSCGICSDTFAQSRSLAAHMKTHSDLNPYKCGICNQGFLKLSTLSEHIKLHPTDKSFPCHLCSCSFSQSGSLNIHLQTHSSSQECCFENGNGCTQQANCNTISNNPTSQIYSGTQNNCFPSSNCIPSCDTISDVIPSQCSAVSSQEFRCHICFKSFTNTVLLNDHIKLLHADSKSFECDVCEKTYPDSRSLAQHIRTHVGEKIFECDICHKVFSQSSNLNTHRRIHSGERPFRCIVCQKTFTESGNLRRHMRTHSGEKPFSCNICGKSFSQSSHVVKHKGIHLKTENFKAKGPSKRLGHKAITNSKTMNNRKSKPGRSPNKKVKSKPRAAPLNVIKLPSPSGKMMYKCTICERVFKESGNITRHMRTHTGEKPFSCSICSKSFSQATHVNKHMKTHQSNSMFNCEICFIDFKEIEALFEHMKIHSSLNIKEQESLELVPAYIEEPPYVEEPPYTEEPPFMEEPPILTELPLDADTIVCVKKEEEKPDISSSVYTVPGQDFPNMNIEVCNEACNSMPCSDVDGCPDKQCLDFNATDSHCSLNTNNMTLDVKYTRLRFPTNNHSEIYECDICHKTFTRTSLLTKHKRKHSNQKSYHCNTCGKLFTESGNLSRHMRIHSGEKPYKCSVCSRAFSQSTHLRKHMNTHTESKPYPCHLCQKPFKKEIDLNKHMESHIEPASFKCDICDKVFTERNKLQCHLRVHADRRPFQCDICQKSFSQPSLLSKHKKIHFGEKPFKCDHCGKGFSESGNLNRHLRTHTGEKPYSCKICCKAFSQASHVNKHLKTHAETFSLATDDERGPYIVSSFSFNPTAKEGEVAATSVISATNPDASTILPEGLLAPYNDISRYVRFFPDSELCQCTNCGQSFTVSQYTDHITACLATNPDETAAADLDMAVNEAGDNKMTEESGNVDTKPNATAMNDDVQADMLGQCKSIFTQSDHLSDVINSYCGRQSEIHIKTEII